MERLGSGIRLIFDSCRQAGIRKPEFNENGDYVKVIFYFERTPLNRADLTEEDILKMFHHTDNLRPSDIADKYTFSRNTITRRLNALVEAHKLIRRGKGAGVYYVLAEK